MFRSMIAALAVLACVATVQAQEPVKKAALSPSDQPNVERPSNIPADVWQYMEAMKRYEDPKMAVRRKAEARAAARQARLESQRWYGISPLRPTASPLPFMGSAAPMWVGNSWDPYRWVSPQRQATIVISRDRLRR